MSAAKLQKSTGGIAPDVQISTEERPPPAMFFNNQQARYRNIESEPSLGEPRQWHFALALLLFAVTISLFVFALNV
jgi:hypothetical protein